MVASLEAMSLHQPAEAGFDWAQEYLWQVGAQLTKGML
jgi:hypothetical protein